MNVRLVRIFLRGLRPLLLGLTGCTLITNISAARQDLPADTGELIVKFKADASDAQIADGLQRGKLKVKRHLQTRPMAELRHNGLTVTESSLSKEEAIANLKNHPAVEYVEPNYIYTHENVANDPYATGNYLWGMEGDLSTPANSFGSQAAEAWGQGYVGSNDIYVGVIDEGIQVTHPDLAQNIWNNPFDPPDGIDNDGNGYVDDGNGWDFYNNQNQVFNPADGDDHGTHVAGTIGAKGGNALGVAGVNWNVKIISAKFMGGGSGSTLAAVEAIDYLVDLKKRHGLNIVAINASWGGSGYSQSLHDAIIRAAKAGILFVAAAGNSSANNDSVADYPANIDTRVGTSTSTAATFDGVISVAAIDQYGALAGFSNYGASRVHLGAPGVNIYSTLPTDTYGAYSGTSMATPHVTGAVALYASTHPGATADQIRSAILSSVLPTASLAGKTSTGGRLNLSNIIAPSAPSEPPPPTVQPPSAPLISTVLAGQSTVAGNSTVTLTWTSSTGSTGYTVKRATSSAGPWTVVASSVTGTTFSQTVSANGTTYYYAVSASNSGGQSADSTAKSVQPVRPSPSNLTATALSSSQLTLRWADTSSDEQGFKVEYYNGFYWVQLGTGAAGTSAVNLTGTASRSTYYFRIRAYNGAVNTAYSNVATITMP